MKQKHLKWRRLSLWFSMILLIAGGSVLISHTLVRDTTKTFPTQTFLVGAHPTLVLHTVNADIHILSGHAGSIKVEAKGSASGLDIGSNLDLSSFKVSATQQGDTVTVNANANVTVVGAGKDFALTITVPQAAQLEGYYPHQ